MTKIVALEAMSKIFAKKNKDALKPTRFIFFKAEIKMKTTAIAKRKNVYVCGKFVAKYQSGYTKAIPIPRHSAKSIITFEIEDKISA